jgi:hypothetical protein
MKKVIELLKRARETSYDISPHARIVVRLIDNAIAELQNSTPITPDEYREIEGDELDKRAAVYGLYECASHRLGEPPDTYWKPFSYAGALGNPNVSAIVCAYNLKGPPPADWRPE